MSKSKLHYIQYFYEYLLENSYGELLKKHNLNIDHIFWVSNLTNATEALVVLQIYFNENEINSIHDLWNHFKKQDN